MMSMMSQMPKEMIAQMPSQMQEMFAQMMGQMGSQMGAKAAQKEQFVGNHTPTHHQYMREDEYGTNNLSMSPEGDKGEKRYTGRIKRSYDMAGGGGYGFIESNEAKV